MKKSHVITLVVISIGLIIYGICVMYINNSQLTKDELIGYLDKKIIKNGYDFSLKAEKDIDNKHLLLFTFTKKGTNSNFVAISFFHSIGNGKFKYDNYIASTEHTHIATLSTQNKNKNDLYYTIFYGIINQGDTQKYRIISNGKEVIESIKPGEYFIRYYHLKSDKYGTKILPIKEIK
ncbi:hypothetical protein [Ruminiclostridium papyrosolvens]|uniref:Uncharacterized protein n=1 Tax=Ruminiclostridium papyrosolvens C7 TaxID=1330534 RepID=U4QX58_9FIRM|nr:hypothetical protein [Ruminiclostridium papyrosolvens]EPR07485.1 hypothetical protein L323_20315 [Ruminiclostridium papyrosolvens C7]